MPKIVNREDQRRTIRTAARRVFARRGVEAVGLVHVARAAGIGRASIYHYYRDKASLVRDLVRDLLAEEELLFVKALRDTKGSPLRRIEQLTGDLTELFADWATLGRMIIDLWSTSGARFKPFFRRIQRELAELIAQGQRSGEIERSLEAEETAAVVIALVDGLLLLKIVEGNAAGDPAATRRLLVGCVRRILQS
jgi:TetR/AcrR family transcriptional regulator, transcriptional repressor of aconitase